MDKNGAPEVRLDPSSPMCLYLSLVVQDQSLKLR